MTDRSLGASAVGTLLTSALILALGFLNSVLLSRELGAEGRGALAAAMLWPGLLGYLGNLGFGAATLYYAADPERDPGPVLGTALAVGAVQATVAMAAGWVLMPLLLANQAAEVVAASRRFLVVVPLSLILQYGHAVVQARMRFTGLNVLRTLIPAGYLAGTSVLLLRGRLSVEAVLAILVALHALAAAGTLLYLKAGGLVRSVAPSAAMGREMIRYGLRVQAGDMSHIANIQLDQALIAALLPTRDLGLYVAAVTAVSPVQALAHTARMVGTPAVANAPAAERTAVMRRTFRHYWLASLIVAVPLAAALPVLIPLVFGASFREAVAPAEILVLAALALGAREVLNGAAQALGRPWIASRADMLSAAITVGGLLLLLRAMGIEAAAAVSAVAYAAGVALVVRGLRSFGISARDLFAVGAAEMRGLAQSGRHVAAALRRSGPLAAPPPGTP